MAYGRMISKDFWVSAEFAGHPYWVQVLVAGMLCSADDDGLIRADSEWLRSRFLARKRPLRVPSVSSVERVLSTLVASKMLLTCKQGDVSYYQFTNFHCYQRLRRRGREGKGREEKGREHPIFEKRRRARTEALNGDGLDD